MTRVGAVDCGTNTVKLLVADLDPESGEETELVREARIVRLGQDVDRTGRLADEALARTFAAVDEYAGIVERHHVDVLRFCATSAARDAQNSEVFREGIRARLGVDPDVVTGAEEAQLSYDGATRSLLGKGLPAPFLVVDIGGGSTELILGDPGTPGETHGHVIAARSLDIGSVRMTERLMPSDPPTRDEVVAATAAIDAALDELAGDGVDLPAAGTVVGVAGTITAVAALLLGLEQYDHAAIHHSTFPLGDVHAITERLLAMPVADRVALHIPEGRADVIGAGALILDRVLRRTTVDRLLASGTDILDGIAWSVA